VLIQVYADAYDEVSILRLPSQAWLIKLLCQGQSDYLCNSPFTVSSRGTRASGKTRGSAKKAIKGSRELSGPGADTPTGLNLTDYDRLTAQIRWSTYVEHANPT